MTDRAAGRDPDHRLPASPADGPARGGQGSARPAVTPGRSDPRTTAEQPGPAGPRRTRGRRRAPGAGPTRWLAAGAVAVLAAVVGLTLALRAGVTPACAQPPAGRQQGKATFYDSKGAGGNCSLPGAPSNRLYVALGPTEYAAGAACGGHLDVTGPKGTVRVLVMDQCPECAPGHLDLSREAFARIADPVQGLVPVSYRAVVDPPLSGPLTFRIKEGASRWWFAVLVGGHGNPLRSVEANSGDGWRTASRTDYNYWIVESGAGPGPYRIRVTDASGHRVTAAGITMTPEKIQRSTVSMYGRNRATAPSRPPTPSPTPSARPSATPTTPVSPPAGRQPSTAGVDPAGQPLADAAPGDCGS